MQYRIQDPKKLSTIGVGGYALSGVYGQKDTQAFIPLVRRAYDLGVTFFDVADIYGPAEEVLGRAIAPFRDQVWVATKVGWGAEGKPDCSPEHILASCDRSLERLGTDYIDLYQLHFNDPGTPVEETVTALEKLKEMGKIRHYGVGHMPLERLEAFFTAGEVFSCLVELSAVARNARASTLPLCQAQEVAVIAFSVTGRGLLTGKIRPGHVFEEGDIRRMDPLFQRERFASGLRVAEWFQVLGDKYGAKPVQLAIAWVLAQQGVVCALTGPSSLPHLEENLDAAALTLLPEDLEMLERFFVVEDNRLREEQRGSLRAILEGALKPGTAFTALVYVFESLIEAGYAAEEQIMPLFLRLYALRGKEGPEVLDEMSAIQAELREQFLPILLAA